MCEIITPDGRWYDIEIPVQHGVMVDDARESVFLIDPDCQYQSEDGTWHQIIFEKSAQPLKLFKDPMDEALSDAMEQAGQGDVTLAEELFDLTFQRKQADGFKQSSESSKRDWFLKIVSIVMVGLIVIVGISYMAG